MTVAEVNQPPALSFATSQSVHAESTLSFTAMAEDPDLPTQLLTFSLDPGAPAGAAIDAFTGQFTWTPAPGHIGSSVMTVRVADSSAPSATTSRPLTVQVLPSLRASLSQSGSQVNVSFPTIPGRLYRVEFKNALDAGTWTPLGTDTLATGARLNFPDDLGASSCRFYRVVQVN